mgnify:CR=1 FL=1
MAEKKVVRYKLVRHKWPDEIAAEKRERRKKLAVICSCLLFFAAGFFVSGAMGLRQPPEMNFRSWRKSIPS